MVEYLRVFDHVGFFYCMRWHGTCKYPQTNPWNQATSDEAQSIVHAAGAFEEQRNGHLPDMRAVVVF